MASTAAQVRTAFSAVFDTANMQAITESVYDYDLLALIEFGNEGRFISDAMHEGDINFIQWVTKRVEVHTAAGAKQNNYTIELTYTRQVDKDGSAHKTVCDVWNTLLTEISSELGKRISDTVSGYLPQEDTPEIALIEINGAPCWQSSFIISAFS